jgi:hypothetical protein
MTINYHSQKQIEELIKSNELSNNQKFIQLLDIIEKELHKAEQTGYQNCIDDGTEYNYGKENGYNQGWDDAQNEKLKEISEPKILIQSIMHEAGYDDFTLKDIFEEFKLQMKFKNLI